LRLTLFAAVAVMVTGYIGAITVSTLAAREITGSPLWAGFPSAMAVIGTAAGTALLGQVVPTSGRRRGLAAATAAGMAGAVMSIAAVSAGSFALLTAGMFVLGFGNAASQFARYTAAELAAPERRGSAVSLIVFAGTVGAVVGPRLLEPMGRVGSALTGSTYAGGYLAALGALVCAELLYLIALRPEPSRVAVADPPDEITAAAPLSPFRHPGVRLALATMIVGQVVMVLIMTATPIHIEDTGFGLELVGVIISAHTLGMFAFAPLVGRLVDRLGPEPVMAAGMILLTVAGAGAATAPDHATTRLGWALFLLGLGWSCGFVGGSALLTRAVGASERPRVQGRVDALVWTASAVAGIASGPALAGPGYRPMSVVGTLLVVIPLAMLVTGRLRPRFAA
jgi:MFS family permease